MTTGSRSPCRNSLHFSPAFAGEFCFASWPFQPPSILPVSSSFTDRAIYFLLSRDFVSQIIIKSIFNKSIFLIARRTQGSFSSRDEKPAVAMASIISTKTLSILSPRVCLWSLGRIW